MATEEKNYDELVLKDSPEPDADIIRRTYPNGRAEYVISRQYNEDRLLNSGDIRDGDLCDIMQEYIWDMQDLVGIMDDDGIRIRLYRCLKFIGEIYEKRIEELFDLMERDIGTVKYEATRFEDSSIHKSGRILRVWIEPARKEE